MRGLAATAAAIGAVAIWSASAIGSTMPVAYCPLPASHGTPAWAFRAGVPITRSSGSYAHGHGSLHGHAAGGAICQVDRVAGAPDRQIVLSIGHRAVTPHHAVTVNGVLGNEMRLPVRVTASTDAACQVGTTGTVTLFASYNGVHMDAARFKFAKACANHDHGYKGSGVVALVPR